MVIVDSDTIHCNAWELRIRDNTTYNSAPSSLGDVIKHILLILLQWFAFRVNKSITESKQKHNILVNMSVKPFTVDYLLMRQIKNMLSTSTVPLTAGVRLTHLISH